MSTFSPQTITTEETIMGEDSSELNVNINDLMESALCTVTEALVDAPGAQKLLLSHLQSISAEAKQEHLNIKRASTHVIEELLGNITQDCEITKHHKTPTDAAFSSSTSTNSKVSRLVLLGKKILSENSNNSDSGNDINVAVLVLSYIFNALMDSSQGRRCFLSVLYQRISRAKEDYLNIKKTSTSKHNRVLEDECRVWGSTKASPQMPPTDTACASSEEGKLKASCSFMLDEKDVAENITSSDDINLVELVYCRVLDDLMNTPQGKKRFLSRLRRISLEAREEYLKIKAANIPHTAGLIEDEDQTSSLEASSTTRKSKASFENMCEKFLPGCKLPEGLLLAQSIYCAKAALAFYNKKHGTDFMLVEPLSSGRHLDDRIRFHSNFRAKKNGSHSSQVELFYADFCYFKKKVHDMHCCIIDPAKAIFRCCQNCPPDLAHCDQRSTNFLRWHYQFTPKELKTRKNQFCAKTALDSYNEKLGTEYKLVKSLNSNIVPVSFGVYQFHCNFKAKLEYPGSSDDASSKLFFSEFVMRTPTSDVDCCILETTEGLDDHCSICPRGIFHPAHYKDSVNLCG